jgi:hypothetical protein
MFAQDNLVAWCIVPFDAKKRNPQQRAEMLDQLGIKRLAYDYRAEHVPSFEEEIETMNKHGIEITAWWFPGALNDLLPKRSIARSPCTITVDGLVNLRTKYVCFERSIFPT